MPRKSLLLLAVNEPARAPAPGDRGGPALDFLIYATKPGFYRMFAQVQIGGGRSSSRSA